jgi:FkbM family methyltransferase
MDWIREIKRRVYRTLNRRGLRLILAALATIYATVRARKLCRVSHEGNWVQRFPCCTLVELRPTLLTWKEIEESLRDLWMYQFLPSEGETVMDVGAGTGWETLVFSRQVGKSGRVISIEAHPRVFSCLSKMCEENQLGNITLIQAAIIDSERGVLLTDFDEYIGNRIVKVDSGISVEGTTLDRIFESRQLSQIDLLKMNIEGAERYAIAGMREMVRRTRHVCISCHDFVADKDGPEEMRTKAEVIAFLKQNGFDVFLRESDPRPEVRDYVYGLNRKLVTHDDRGAKLHGDAPSSLVSIERIVPLRE